MRYDPKRKTARDDQLVEFVASHPDWSYDEVGKQFNISRARVSSILIKRGIRYRPPKAK